MKSVNDQFEEVFSDMAEQAKPINAEESATAQEYDRGVADCIKGINTKTRAQHITLVMVMNIHIRWQSQGVSYEQRN